MSAHRPDGAARRDAITRFYGERAGRLQRLVTRRATAPPQVIEDACQVAWMHLTRRPDIPLDASGFAWLAVVATREAWTQATPKDQPAGVFIGFDGDQPAELAEPAGPGSDPLELAIAHEGHAERLEAFATLKPRERRDLLLKATGYTYDEIAAMTGATYTAVNRRLTEGRARARAARSEHRGDQ
jgi:DNA-directed RNA polymerase specialized sigma24 family protein